MRFTRAESLAGIAVAFGSITARFAARVDAQSMHEQRTSDARTSLYERQSYPASSARVYNALLDSKSFADFTHAPARIEPTEGGAFSLFGGLIVGRNVELVRNERIVQAWRSDEAWNQGVFSIVRFDIVMQGNEASLSITQTGFPVGTYDHLYAGWQAHYLQPLAAYLG